MYYDDRDHKPNDQLRQRVKDLAFAGIPKYLIAKIIKIDPDTLVKYYEHELECTEPEAIARIAKVASIQAENGCTKSQALILKTRGAKYGFIEKQVIETVSQDDTQALKDKIQELENKHEKDY